MLTRPRRPLLCPRTSLTVTAKKPAHLPASRQTTRDGIAGEHAAVLRDRRAAAPTSSTRCAKAQLAAESRGSSTGRMRSSSARGARDISRVRKSASKRTPNHPLSRASTLSALSRASTLSAVGSDLETSQNHGSIRLTLWFTKPKAAKCDLY